MGVLQLIGVCVLAAIALVEGDVKCRTCTNSPDLAACTGFTDCKSGEKCFMQEVIAIDTGKIAYNGGCRAVDGCPKKGGDFGKRDLFEVDARYKRQGDTNTLSSCLRCCDDAFNVTSQTSCNDALCGIPKGNITGKCYKCGTFVPESGITDPNACQEVVDCEPNEMCRATKYEESGQDHFIFGCFRKTICRILGSRAVIQYANYKNLPTPTTHKRVRICDICCDDGLCNNSDCTFITEKLYTQWAAGALDLDTLSLKNKTSGP